MTWPADLAVVSNAPALKRDRVTQLLRGAILRGDYADGQHVSQEQLAAQYGVGRSVIRQALASLRDEGHVSSDGRDRFHVNAGYITRRLQLTLNKLEDVERLASRTIVLLGADPHYPSARKPGRR